MWLRHRRRLHKHTRASVTSGIARRLVVIHERLCTCRWMSPVGLLRANTRAHTQPCELCAARGRTIGAGAHCGTIDRQPSSSGSSRELPGYTYNAVYDKARSTLSRNSLSLSLKLFPIFFCIISHSGKKKHFPSAQPSPSQIRT